MKDTYKTFSTILIVVIAIILILWWRMDDAKVKKIETQQDRIQQLESFIEEKGYDIP